MSKVSQREVAESFLRMVASGQVKEAYQKHVSQDFVHHNPYFQADRESLMLAMEGDAVKNPNKILEIKLTLEDGDLVSTYSHIKQTPEDPGFAVVHIFRFEDSRIVELWDVGQAVPEATPNERGMF
ncbi:MAG: ester cyclase [Promethearchaeota archaeon]